MLATNNILNLQLHHHHHQQLQQQQHQHQQQQQQQQQQHPQHQQQQQQQQQQHLHQQHHHLHTSALPSYNLFSSMSLFGMETPSNQGLVNDFGSSSTSPNTDYLDDDCYLKLRDTIIPNDSINVAFQLKEANDNIHLLNQRINVLADELQKKQKTIHTLQSTIALKDMEIHKMLATMNHLCDQSKGQNAEFKYKNNPTLNENEHEGVNKWIRWNDDGDKKNESRPIDYDFLVNKILQNNDQQSSIFLQQKLKTCSAEQKQLIFEAIHRESFGLMTNRFGNFLVQKLFDLGTQAQINLLAETMKGQMLTLTCEPFGCHVVQKALDSVDEKTKAILVTELFENIPDTILHKSACHVWQKIFEIRWVHYPVNIMERMYEALKGRWTQVALDETGSLVIQNIFENLPEADKRPVIDEILESMFTIARGQWGNWVIQHILECGEQSKDREMAFDMVLNQGIQLSMDQFASKVVEKALSIGGPAYMSKFIHHISTSNRSNKPRIALIDIAGDQYGNYVVQWILNNAPESQKIDVCRLIKKHMVSLRGSKYGQRVAFLVEKALKHQDITTYPTTS